MCADKPTRAMERMRVGDVVRCRDCASIKPTTDGRRYRRAYRRVVEGGGGAVRDFSRRFCISAP